MASFGRPPPMAGPPAPIAKTLKVAKADEDMARALGCALVLQWDALPDALQDLLIDQAVIAHVPTALRDREAFETFIRTAKVAPVSPRIPTDT